jgi:hypothetical protein
LANGSPALIQQPPDRFDDDPAGDDKKRAAVRKGRADLVGGYFIHEVAPSLNLGIQVSIPLRATAIERHGCCPLDVDQARDRRIFKRAFQHCAAAQAAQVIHTWMLETFVSAI